MIYEIISLIAVAVLWGCTNPLIKQGTKDINKVKCDSKLKQFLMELKYLFTNFGVSITPLLATFKMSWYKNYLPNTIHYIVPMGLNQLGSVLYFLTLQHVEISLAVPVANSLTFVFTAIMGWFLNEGLPSKKTLFGVLLVLSGTALLCYDKYLQKIS